MFLRLNIRYTVIKLVCLVLCFKPFKIPFSVSCGLYRNNERNKKTCLSWCKIQSTEMPRFRCPLTSVPVRSAGFFSSPDGCNIAPGKTRPRRLFKVFTKNFPPRILLSPDNSELYLCMPKNFSAYKGARSARPGGVPESRHLNYQLDDNHEKEDRTPDNDRSQSPQV